MDEGIYIWLLEINWEYWSIVDIRVGPAAESQHGLEVGILVFQAGEFPM